MQQEEIEEIIIQELTFNFPRLTLETICDIAEILHERWGWKEDSLSEMKEYISKDIKVSEKPFFCVYLDGEQYIRTEENCDLDETENVYLMML